MKAMLYNAVQEAPSAEIVEPKVLARFFANFDESFFTFSEKGEICGAASFPQIANPRVNLAENVMVL